MGKRAALLKEYVANGGILIIGCRSGYKQENGKCVMLPQPGLFAENYWFRCERFYIHKSSRAVCHRQLGRSDD
ncbi:MAG: beta-galactosidase trimerization domain-containing protein [Blautia faecis]